MKWIWPEDAILYNNYRKCHQNEEPLEHCKTKQDKTMSKYKQSIQAKRVNDLEKTELSEQRKTTDFEEYTRFDWVRSAR